MFGVSQASVTAAFIVLALVASTARASDNWDRHNTRTHWGSNHPVQQHHPIPHHPHPQMGPGPVCRPVAPPCTCGRGHYVTRYIPPQVRWVRGACGNLIRICNPGRYERVFIPAVCPAHRGGGYGHGSDRHFSHGYRSNPDDRSSLRLGVSFRTEF